MHPMYLNMSVNTLMAVWSDLLEVKSRTEQSLEEKQYTSEEYREVYQGYVSLYQKHIDEIKELIERKRRV